MSVVAAGVHHVDFFTEVGAFGFRGERQVRDFLDRQRIHVGAQCYGRSGQRAFEDGDDASAGYTGFHFQAHRAKLFGDHFRRAFFGIAQFRMGVDIAAGFEQLGFQGFGLFGDVRAGAFPCVGAGVDGQCAEQGQQTRLCNAGQLHRYSPWLLFFWLQCL